MVRRPLIAASVLPLLFCCVLWARSYWVADSLERRTESVAPHAYSWAVFAITSTAGSFELDDRRFSETNTIGISRESAFHDARRGWVWEKNQHPSRRRHIDGPTFQFEHFGFIWDSDTGDDTRSFHSAEFPQLDSAWTYSWRSRLLVVPFWSLFLLTGTPAGIVLLRKIVVARIRSRKAKGLCPNCGYDLRATKQRCPECGTVSKNRG
jgi:hypothetical protein